MSVELGLNYGLTACTGAEVNILADGTFAIRILDLSLQKKLIHIDCKKEYSVSLNQISTISCKGPLAVTLTGKGVLIKKSAKLENLTEQSLRHLFPGFKPAEFYVQHFSSADSSFVAFVRREIADPVLAALRKQGGQILLFSLGPFVVGQVIPQLNNYSENLNFNGHQISLNPDKDWLDYQYTPDTTAGFELKIDIEVIPEQYLLAYASAFQLILNDRLELIHVADEQINQELLELLAALKFKKNGTLLLAVLFGLLLINFLLFSYYNTANQELAGKAGQRSNQSSDREKLMADVKEKEQQVQLLGWNHGQNYAFLCDQIGQTVPLTITLTDMNINGIRDKYENSLKRTATETGTIKITGQSASVYVINDWIYALKQKSWVKNVQLEKYGTDLQKEVQVFTLNLTY